MREGHILIARDGVAEKAQGSVAQTTPGLVGVRSAQLTVDEVEAERALGIEAPATRLSPGDHLASDRGQVLTRIQQLGNNRLVCVEKIAPKGVEQLIASDLGLGQDQVRLQPDQLLGIRVGLRRPPQAKGVRRPQSLRSCRRVKPASRVGAE